MSTADYINYRVIEARYLCPPMRTYELLDYLVYHFPEEIRASLQKEVFKTVDEFQDVLEGMESRRRCDAMHARFDQSRNATSEATANQPRGFDRVSETRS